MNVATYLENSAARHPDKAAIRFLGDSITFGELNAASSRLAGELAALGLKPGDRCLVILPNSIRQVTLYYALAKLGAIEVPVNFLYRVHEITHIVQNSQPAAFIGAEPYLEEISKVLEGREAPSIRLVIGATEKSGFTPLDDLLSGSADFATYPADDNDTSNILYTSGTTGASKGVMLTHKNLARNARIISEMRGAIEPDTVIIGVLPLYHIYGITKAYQKTHFQGRMVACGPEGYKPPDFRKVVRAYGVKLITIDHPPEVRAKINEVLNYDGPVVCDVNTHDYQTYEPRIFGWKTPIEDMYPYLPREEFLSNMYIEPMEGWDNPVYPDVA